MSMDKAENTLQDMYHPFYTYVDKRMVLISANDGCKLQFSEESKQLLRNKVEPFLEKAVTREKWVDGKKVVFKDLKSRTLLKINEQTIIYYLKYPLQKRSLPPVVVKKKWF